MFAIMMDLNGPTLVVNHLHEKQLTLKMDDVIEVYADKPVDGNHGDIDFL